MRLFFAHPRAWSDEEIDAACAAVLASVEAETGKAAEVVSGRDDYNTNIAGCGRVDSWCRDIIVRTDYQSGLAWYAAIVVPRTEGIGKATATIVRLALAAQMPVLEATISEGQVKTRPVRAVREVDAEDYLAGWRLVISDT